MTFNIFFISYIVGSAKSKGKSGKRPSASKSARGSKPPKKVPPAKKPKSPTRKSPRKVPPKAKPPVAKKTTGAISGKYSTYMFRVH